MWEWMCGGEVVRMLVVIVYVCLCARGSSQVGMFSQLDDNSERKIKNFEHIIKS